MRRFDKLLVPSYSMDDWELRVWIGDSQYVYSDVTPFQADKFSAMARKNKGKAMAFLKGLGKCHTKSKST